jgi:phage terminase Nu1 subunit (DNA packaging protein)
MKEYYVVHEYDVANGKLKRRYDGSLYETEERARLAIAMLLSQSSLYNSAYVILKIFSRF